MANHIPTLCNSEDLISDLTKYAKRISTPLTTIQDYLGSSEGEFLHSLVGATEVKRIQGVNYNDLSEYDLVVFDDNVELTEDISDYDTVSEDLYSEFSYNRGITYKDYDRLIEDYFREVDEEEMNEEVTRGIQEDEDDSFLDLLDLEEDLEEDFSYKDVQETTSVDKNASEDEENGFDFDEDEEDSNLDTEEVFEFEDDFNFEETEEEEDFDFDEEEEEEEEEVEDSEEDFDFEEEEEEDEEEESNLDIEDDFDFEEEEKEDEEEEEEEDEDESNLDIEDDFDFEEGSSDTEDTFDFEEDEIFESEEEEESVKEEVEEFGSNERSTGVVESSEDSINFEQEFVDEFDIPNLDDKTDIIDDEIKESEIDAEDEDNTYIGLRLKSSGGLVLKNRVSEIKEDKDREQGVEKVPDDVVKEVESNKTVTEQQDMVDSEPEPTDLRQFLRKHPKCDYDFALKYFTKKQINDELRRGRITRKGNILRL